MENINFSPKHLEAAKLAFKNEQSISEFLNKFSDCSFDERSKYANAYRFILAKEQAK